MVEVIDGFNELLNSEGSGENVLDPVARASVLKGNMGNFLKRSPKEFMLDCTTSIKLQAAGKGNMAVTS